ncbi:pyridoxal-phosphate dependent enzyme [Actinomycetospora endophytica]|uniref:Pyridoxal-phosphate dependent enzyme n=1 Tax=Actinomycetospora endophytica TaxID=2291215 RepID=A0ABS8PGA1_9PSEU|nr:pyridoxal-phosphate dependent enzyme [Actinomycetospora endophytica]MCD2197297.1 pyridoxal-phosphate dependent enzyme [Actinomycetospora endophytica]
MTAQLLPTVADVEAAVARVSTVADPVTLRPSHVLSDQLGVTVDLVCEYRQPSGSFKIRGAANAVLAAAERGATGVTTASTGNHARAVATVAARAGLRVRAYVASSVSAARVRALTEAGAEVDASAADQTAAIAAASAVRDGEVFVPPFDHAEVVAGQGTLGLEVGERYDAVFVPVSGGGLAAGVGLALRALAPRTRVVGVSAERAPAMARSLAAGHPVSVPEIDTVATSLMGDLGPDNAVTFAVCREVLESVEVVDEDAIVAATDRLHALGHAVEPAAAAGLALLVGRAGEFAGMRVALLLTGRADPS